jgi:hypothetical protein
MKIESGLLQPAAKNEAQLLKLSVLLMAASVH